MSGFFHRWPIKCGSLMLLAALTFFCNWERRGTDADSSVVSASPQILATDLDGNDDQPSHDASALMAGVPVITVHVFAVEFSTTSSDTERLTREFQRRLEEALADFNLQSPSETGSFATSDQLAALARSVPANCQLTIFDETRRSIPVGQTEKWGDAMSIEATPNIDSEGQISVHLAAWLRGSCRKGPIGIEPGQTMICSGFDGSVREERSMKVPLLSQIPRIGSWFEFPVTQFRGTSGRFLIDVKMQSGAISVGNSK